MSCEARAVDRFRRDRTLSAKYQQLAPLTIETAVADVDDAEIEDDRLRMMFVAPSMLPMASRAALTVRLVGGLSTARSRAYLQPEAPSRSGSCAKKTIAAAGVPFEFEGRALDS